MNWIIAILGIMVSVYVGAAIGVYSLCLETPQLCKARKYVAYIPGFIVLFIIYGLLNEDKETRKFMVKFLRIPHKCMFALAFFAEVIEEERAKQPKKRPQKRVIFNGVINQFQNIFQDTRSFYY